MFIDLQDVNLILVYQLHIVHVHVVKILNIMDLFILNQVQHIINLWTVILSLLIQHLQRLMVVLHYLQHFIHYNQ